MNLGRTQRDFEAVSRTVEGRAFLYSVMEISGFFQSSYRDHNSHGTNFSEGKRSIGLMLFNMFQRSQHTRQNFMAMLNENFVLAEDDLNVETPDLGYVEPGPSGP